MKALIQRVDEAAVRIDGDEIARIGRGLLVLLGVLPDDTSAHAAWLADRTAQLRIFPDAAKPMNRSVVDIGGEALVVSQFTLAADTSRGRRPSFTSAAPPALAETLYEHFVQVLATHVRRVATGRFGADMKVHLVNDGPVTFLLGTPDSL